MKPPASEGLFLQTMNLFTGLALAVVAPFVAIGLLMLALEAVSFVQFLLARP